MRPYRESNPKGTWEDWVKAAYFDRVSLSATGFHKTPDLGYDWTTGQGKLFNYFTYGVACTEVEIDVLTGDHQVIRTDIVMDLGECLLRYNFNFRSSMDYFLLKSRICS